MVAQRRDPVVAHVGLGSNVGDSPSTLSSAVHRLMTVPRSRYLGVSRFYRTPAWGLEDQPDFINAVVALETMLAPRALLEELLRIERDFGRRRVPGRRWGPRSLDLDLLLYGDVVIDTPGLRVPHPHLHERAFALVPLAEIAAAEPFPGHGSVGQALRQVDVQGVEVLDGQAAADACEGGTKRATPR